MIHQTASLTAVVSARHADCVLLGSIVVEKELDFVVSVVQADSALSFYAGDQGFVSSGTAAYLVFRLKPRLSCLRRSWRSLTERSGPPRHRSQESLS